MDLAVAKTCFDQASEEARDLLANELYYRELDTIRREQPLIDPSKCLLLPLPLYDRNVKSAEPPGNPPRRQPEAPPPRPTPTTDPGSIKMRGGAAPSLEDSLDEISPYILRVLSRMALVELLGTDEAGEPAEQQLPGPLSKMRLDISKIRETVGHKRSLEEEFPNELEAAKIDFLTTGYEHMDQETMLQGRDWLGHYLSDDKIGGRPILFKGFPMVEHVVFIKHPNYWHEPETHGKVVASGQCYWLAIALLIYGNASSWLRVKAEHLNYLEKVLSNPKHPRHAFYLRETQNNMRTYATGPAGKEGIWGGEANMWERLHIPGCWTSEDMCQLTADVYGVFLVLYKFNARNPQSPWANMIYDMKTYGAYNSRHIFLCYVHENHFQPMVPNDFYAHEFKLPRLTLQNTKRYRLVTRPHTRRIGDGPRHHWRGQAKVAPPPLALPGYDAQHLARAAGYVPGVNEPQPQPQAQTKPRSRPPSELRINAALAESMEKPDSLLRSPYITHPELLKSPKHESDPTRPPPTPSQVILLYCAGSKRAWSKHSWSKHAYSKHAYFKLVSSKRILEELLTPAKRLRRMLGPAPPPSPDRLIQTQPSRSPKVSFTPINNRNQPPASPTSHYYALAESSRDTLSRLQAASATQPKPEPPTQPTPSPPAKPPSAAATSPAKQRPQRPLAPASHPRQPQQAQPDRYFRKPATKSLLRKVLIRRLKRWVAELGLAGPRDNLHGWKKERVCDKLFAAGVELLMTRPAKGPPEVVGEREELRGGVTVVRLVEEKKEGEEEEGEEENDEEDEDEEGGEEEDGGETDDDGGEVEDGDREGVNHHRLLL
ncbi:hypothetical protein F5144DRAFT_635234 [Chaetomium tenue]|uniref:Uncharacterized protein n=1 Tax=Chaetomium tenue TaxID=1854479 RepID=A0ACB7PNJ2_9PEZI|nr:hypothetical protein F5144DRAFT_635234 [Chaetomium globosum]